MIVMINCCMPYSVLRSLKDKPFTYVNKRFYLYAKTGKSNLPFSLRYSTLTALIIGVVCFMISMDYIAILLVSESFIWR